jgi:hypothetical protein
VLPVPNNTSAVTTINRGFFIWDLAVIDPEPYP